MKTTILLGDCLEQLKNIPSESVNCCVTSPPYYGLRDYGIDGQIGLESTPDHYLTELTSVFEEVRRILKPDGTLWLNIGDSYAAHKDCKSVAQTLASGTKSENAHVIQKGDSRTRDYKMLKVHGYKNKDLMGITWRLAESLRAGMFFCEDCETESLATNRLYDGRLLCKNCGSCQPVSVSVYGDWYLRQDIIWHKPNPMPESVTDRCTKSHEYIFLLSKSGRYYYDADAIKEHSLTKDNSNPDRDNSKLNNTPGRTRMAGLTTNHYEQRNKRSVWTVTTKPFEGAHFATFPQDLITDCIKAGCPENGTVLDPFGGAMTTALVANKLGRNAIAIELNPEYVEIGKRRLQKELGFMCEIETQLTHNQNH